MVTMSDMIELMDLIAVSLSGVGVVAGFIMASFVAAA